MTLSSGTGSEYFVNNGSKEVGNVTYKITNNGIQKITYKAENVSALYDGSGNVQFNCTIKPNSLVDLLLDGKVYTEMSNEQVVVSATVKGNYGDEINIIPVNGLESKTKVGINNKDFVLLGQMINVENVWNQGMFSIGFNENNTFKINWAGGETNPYYTRADSFSLQLLNSRGQAISQKIVERGAVHPYSDVYKIFNGKKFSYGDILHIESNSGATVTVGNNSYKNNIYLKLNQNGIEYLQANNNSYKAENNDLNTIVSGIIAANSNSTIEANGESYNVISNNNGQFSLTLPATVKVGDMINIINAQGVTESVKVQFDKSEFAILNSKIQVINGWGTDAFNISFNPETMRIEGSGFNQYLGDSSGNPFISLSLYNPQGNIVKNIMLNGSDNTNYLDKIINNLPFSFGDTIAINYDSSQGKINLLMVINQLEIVMGI